MDTQINPSQVKSLDTHVQSLIAAEGLAPSAHDHDAAYSAVDHVHEGGGGSAFDPEYFTATADQTDFVLAQEPTAGIMVFRNGLLQAETTHYTVAADTVTLLTAAEVGEAITVVYGLGGGTSVSEPSPDDVPDSPNAWDKEFTADDVSTLPTDGVQIGSLTGATYLEKYGRGSLRVPASTGWNIRAILFPVPAGATWTIRAKMEYVGILANYWQMGFYLGNLVNTKLHHIGQDGRGAEYTWWNSPTSYSGESGKILYPGTWGGEFYAELKKNSETSYDFAMSADGINWTTLWTALDFSSFQSTPVTMIGFGANNEHNSVCYGVCHWMRKVA